MLGLAIIHKNVDNIKKKKNILLSFCMIMMFMVASITSIIILVPQSVVADDVGADYGDANYTYYENYDTDSLGNHVTGEDWYTFGNYSYNDDHDPGDYGSVVNVLYNSSPNSYLWEGSNDGDTFGVCYNFTTGIDLDYINFKFRQTSSNDDAVIMVCYGNDCPYKDNAQLYFILNDNGEDEFRVGTGSGNVKAFDISFNVWYNVTVILNYTTEHVGVYKDGVLQSWIDQSARGLTANQSMNKVCIGSSGYPTAYVYIDDLEIGCRQNLTAPDTDPYIDSNAFTSSLTTIGQENCITFSGSPGDIKWSNNSGINHETMDVYVRDGDSDVTRINISMWDVSSGVYTIDAEDFGVACCDIPDGTFHDLGYFPNGGGNITLNGSIWVWSGDPFDISGDDHVYFRFYVNTVGYPVAIYDIEASECKVYILGNE